VSHVEAGISGRYTSTFPNPSLNTAGAIAGVVTGTAASVFLTPDEPLACSPTFSVSGIFYVSVAIAGEQLTGSYSTFTCVGGRAGTLILSRQ
jgi:hypothetical protein